MLKSGRTKAIGLLLVLLLFTLLIPAQAVLANGDEDWPQFHKDETNVGVTTSEAPYSAYLKWSTDDIGAVDASSLAVGDGKVFVICDVGVRCLDVEDGSVEWTHAVSATGADNSWAGPAYHDGRVFLSTDGIYCLDASDGHELWSYIFPSGLHAVNASVTVADGKVIASDWSQSGTGSTYYCVSESTGSYLWEFSVPGYSQGTAAYHNSNFFLTSWENVGGHVFCVNATSGAEVWHSNGIVDETYEYDTCGSVCVAAGKVFFTTYNFYDYGELMALNESDGSVAWGPVLIERTDSTPAYADGRLYLCGGCYGFSNQGERTYCFNAANGNLVWRTDVDTPAPGSSDIGNWTCSPAVADGKVFVGRPNQGENPMYFDYIGIYALDISDGSEVWHYDHGGASPSVSGGVVFTVGEGKVWAFGPPDYPAWDVNHDGVVDVSDLVLVGTHFGEEGDPSWIPEDVNGDGVVDVSDLVIIGAHFD